MGVFGRCFAMATSKKFCKIIQQKTDNSFSKSHSVNGLRWSATLELHKKDGSPFQNSKYTTVIVITVNTQNNKNDLRTWRTTSNGWQFICSDNTIFMANDQHKLRGPDQFKWIKISTNSTRICELSSYDTQDCENIYT